MLQLCRNLYCFFQFVVLPPFPCTSTSSSSHLLLREEKCNLSSFWVLVVLIPGILKARGSTKRL